MKTLYFKIICLAGMLFCCWVTVANDYLKTGYSYRKYSVNDGLPESMVWSLFQDDKGFIWMGTYNGFVRYDGAAFKTYLSDKDYNVLRVTESVSGNIHALLFRQIYTTLPNDSLKLKKIEKWRLCPYTGRSMPAGYVFYEDTGNKEKALFAVTDTGLVKTWGHNILNNMEQYRKPYWDRNAKLFYVPTAKGVYLIAEDGIVRDSIPVTTIHCIVPHQNGLWAVGSDGIFKYVDGGLHKEYGHTFHFDPTVGINAIPGDDGKLFIQSYTKIDRFDNGQLETVAEETIIYDMLIDREKNLWIATYNGVYNFFRLNFKDYILMHGEDVVRSIISDDKGGILAATMENLLIHISGNAYELIPHPRIPDVSFFQGKPGVTDRKYYFPGMYQTGDVMRYHDGKSNWLNLPASMYHYVEVLPGGNLLVGGYTRMLICNPDGGVIRELDVAKLKQQPACAYADKQGRIWIGGAAGISIVDGDSIYSKFDNNYAPAQNMVADKNGNIWFSAQNRLYSISGDSIRLMHTFSGTTVRGVLFTRNNTLIVSILQGICVLSPGSSGFLYYDKYNGFMGEKLIRGTPVEDNDGYVWVISQNGLVRFRPDDLIYKQPAPVLHLQIVQSSTDNIHWATMNDESVSLKYREKNIKFSFIGICYSATGNVRYQYRLTGFQDEWSQPVAEREVTFNNLPPGRYEFQLKANSGVPGTETPVVNQSFIILPAFWQTWWFYVICITILVFVGGWTAYRYLNKKNAEKIRALERQKQLNNLQIQSIRLRSIPHFNANVLAGIEYYIMNFSKEEANHYLAMYASFTNLTLRDVDQPARTLAQEICYVELYLGLEKMRYGEHFDFSIEVASGVDKDIMLPNMILHTHCENAIKHGLRAKKGKGHLRIMADPFMEDEVLVAIEDDGIGRVEAERLQTKGNGQGLYILSQQIDLYNQTNDQPIVQRVIDLTDEHAHACGTRIEIEVPKEFRYN